MLKYNFIIHDVLTRILLGHVYLALEEPLEERETLGPQRLLVLEKQ